MLPYHSKDSHKSNKKDNYDLYENKIHTKGIKKRISIVFSRITTQKRIPLCAIGCVLIFILLLLFVGTSTSSCSFIQQNSYIDTSKFCSFDKETPDYTCTPVSQNRPSFQYISAASLLPVVTVVIPFYNEYTFLEEVFESLALQSLQRIEIIIVNDGSTKEATEEMMKIASAQDADIKKKIRIVPHTKNRGLSAARNTGIAKSTTEYIFFLDSDDLIEPTTLEKCLCYFESLNISHPQIGFVKGYTVGFGGHSYTWDKGFELAERFLQENLVTATAMIRKSVFSEVGGYDEAIRGGMEDWEFWLKCADHGIWGITIPEYLDWYRRRPKNAETKWNNFKGKDKDAFLDVLRVRYKQVFKINGFPKLKHVPQINYEVPHTLPFTNPLVKSSLSPRLLIIVPWFTMGGADRFNLNLVEQLVSRGWEITLVATHTISSTWTSHFMRFTPDVFVLSNNLLRYQDYPRFLCYLIQSRGVEVVMVTNSEAGYMLLPYIQSMCPGPAIVDYSHMEEMDWKNGGYPRYAVAYSDHISKHIVASEHLKNWMISRKVNEDQIAVAYIGVDTDKFTRDQNSRLSVRQTYKIPHDQITILYAARMIPQKQPMVMVHAFKILIEKRVKFTALVAGGGWQRAQIDEFIARHDLGNHIIMLGEVPPAQMPTLMAASDIVFLPSEFEGIASILFEAMAIENVIVGADVGGQSELVTPDVGYLQNISGFEGKGEKAVAALAANYATQLEKMIMNPENVYEMGKRGREKVVDGFSLKSMVNTVEKKVFCEASKEKKKSALPLRTAIEMAGQAMQTINLEEQAYTLYQQNNQLQQKAEEARLMGGQCEADRNELYSVRSSLSKCKSESSSNHDQYLRCEADLALVYMELEDLRTNSSL